MGQEDVVYSHKGILLSNEKHKLILFEAIWMELERIMIGKINQKTKDNASLVSLTCDIYRNQTV